MGETFLFYWQEWVSLHPQNQLWQIYQGAASRLLSLYYHYCEEHHHRDYICFQKHLHFLLKRKRGLLGREDNHE